MEAVMDETKSMGQGLVIRYEMKPETADENQRLIEAVFAELAETKPDTVRYAALRLEDGVSFVHVVFNEEGTDALRLDIGPLNLRVGTVAVTVRDLEPEDEDAVLDVYTASEDWFVAETGQPSAPGDVQSSYYALPEGSDVDDKVLLVIEADGVV